MTSGFLFNARNLQHFHGMHLRFAYTNISRIYLMVNLLQLQQVPWQRALIPLLMNIQMKKLVSLLLERVCVICVYIETDIVLCVGISGFALSASVACGKVCCALEDLWDIMQQFIYCAFLLFHVLLFSLLILYILLLLNQLAQQKIYRMNYCFA